MYLYLATYLLYLSQTLHLDIVSCYLFIIFTLYRIYRPDIDSVSRTCIQIGLRDGFESGTS